MMDLDKNLEDRYSYPLCPQEHRWMYNKLTVAEKMGYYCGPSGTPITKSGFYCIRPIMSCAGNGSGGFLKFHAEQTQTGITQPEYRAGYFWCEWFDGWHAWTNFIDDEPVYECGGFQLNDTIIFHYHPPITFNELPDSLKGISKNMVVEHIGGNLIEVSPRRMVLEFDARPTKFVQEQNDEYGFEWKPYEL